MRPKVSIQSTSTMLKRPMGTTREAVDRDRVRRTATTDDATAGDEAAATGGVMYADEGPYTIATSAMLKQWWGRLEKRRMATESGGNETATRPGRPAVPGTRPAIGRRRRLETNETEATVVVMYTDEGELEFDEDEMAALEGQRLVAKFRCGIY